MPAVNSQTEPSKHELIPKFAQIIRDTMNHMKSEFPKVEKEILQAITIEDQKELALRGFSNLALFILK